MGYLLTSLVIFLTISRQEPDGVPMQPHSTLCLHRFWHFTYCPWLFTCLHFLTRHFLNFNGFTDDLGIWLKWKSQCQYIWVWPRIRHFQQIPRGYWCCQFMDHTLGIQMLDSGLLDIRNLVSWYLSPTPSPSVSPTSSSSVSATLSPFSDRWTLLPKCWLNEYMTERMYQTLCPNYSLAT